MVAYRAAASPTPFTVLFIATAPNFYLRLVFATLITLSLPPVAISAFVVG